MADPDLSILHADSDQPVTPLSTISDVFVSREALEHESRSRRATEEVCRERNERNKRSQKPRKALKAQKGSKEPKEPKEPKYRKNRPQPIRTFNSYSAPVPNIPMAPEQVHYNPYPLPPEERGQQSVMPAPPPLPTGGFYNNGLPFLPLHLAPQNQYQIAPMLPCLDSAAHQYLLNPNVHGTKPEQMTYKQAADAFIENEYDRSRGAFFGRHSAHATVPIEEIRMKAPTTGIATLQRNDIVSLKAEVVAGDSPCSSVGRASKANNILELEEMEAGAPSSHMGQKLREIETRLDVVNEKLDRVLGALGQAPDGNLGE